AWPITQPVRVPTKVTEVGRKLPGTGAGPAGTAELAAAEALPEALLLAEGTVDRLWAPAGAAAGFGFSTGRLTTWGTVTAAATITAAEPAVMASLRYLRRRALRLISSNVPGGGGRGSIRWLSQASTSSCRSGIALPQHGLQPGPRREQVRLDGALRPPQQRGDLPDPEPPVVVQQERVAQPRRQRGDEVAHVHVLYRVGHLVQRRARGDAADGPPLPFGLAPVVAYQVGRDHIEVALRAVHPGPPGQQPDERLGRDLVRGVVVVDQAPDPAGQLGVDALEQLFDGVRVDPSTLASGAHRISLDEVPGRWERRGLASRSPARHEHHVGAGRGVLENTRVIRQLLPHSCSGEAARRSLLAGACSLPTALL